MTETDTIWVASAGKTSPTQGRITVTPAPRTRLRENLSRTMTIMRFMGAYLVRVVVGKGVLKSRAARLGAFACVMLFLLTATILAVILTHDGAGEATTRDLRIEWRSLDGHG